VAPKTNPANAWFTRASGIFYFVGAACCYGFLGAFPEKNVFLMAT
jgi:hypothetical protein